MSNPVLFFFSPSWLVGRWLASSGSAREEVWECAESEHFGAPSWLWASSRNASGGFGERPWSRLPVKGAGNCDCMDQKVRLSSCRKKTYADPRARRHVSTQSRAQARRPDAGTQAGRKAREPPGPEPSRAPQPRSGSRAEPRAAAQPTEPNAGAAQRCSGPSRDAGRGNPKKKSSGFCTWG